MLISKTISLSIKKGTLHGKFLLWEMCFLLVNRVLAQGNMPHLSYLIYSTWPEPDRKLYSDFQGGLLLKKKSNFYRICSGTICWGSSHTIQKCSSKQNITVVCYAFFYAVNVKQNVVNQIIKTPMQLHFVITKIFENTVDIQFYSPLVSTFILTFFWVHALKGLLRWPLHLKPGNHILIHLALERGRNMGKTYSSKEQRPSDRPSNNN